jgi:hypothetical protein
MTYLVAHLVLLRKWAITPSRSRVRSALPPAAVLHCLTPARPPDLAPHTRPGIRPSLVTVAPTPPGPSPAMPLRRPGCLAITAAVVLSAAALPLPRHAHRSAHRTRDPDLDAHRRAHRHPALPRTTQLPRPQRPPHPGDLQRPPTPPPASPRPDRADLPSTSQR